MGIVRLHIRDFVRYFCTELFCCVCSTGDAAVRQAEHPRSFHHSSAINCSNAKSSSTTLEPNSVARFVEGIFTASLLIDCFSEALSLSAFSVLLLILLETTTTSLGAPRLQNIWVLLAITGTCTVILLIFNLLVLYANRELWFLVSYLVLFIWGILICVGYTIAGYRMWQNLKSSRQLGNSTGKGRLKTIITQVFISAFITAVSLILTLFLAGRDYDLVTDNKETGKEDTWSTYAVLFLIRCCEFTIMALIFGIVVRTKSRSNSVDDGQVVQLGTFTEDTTKKYEVMLTGTNALPD